MSVIYNQGLTILSPTAFPSEDIRVLLVTSSYVPDKDHNFVAAVTNEITAVNYIRKALTGKTVSRDDALDLVTYRADSVVWDALGLDAPARVVVFRFNTTDADSPLICCIDIDTPVASNGTDYSLHWSPDGIVRARQAP